MKRKRLFIFLIAALLAAAVFMPQLRRSGTAIDEENDDWAPTAFVMESQAPGEPDVRVLKLLAAESRARLRGRSVRDLKRREERLRNLYSELAETMSSAGDSTERGSQ